MPCVDGSFARLEPQSTRQTLLPTDRTGFDKYFQYTSDERHPGESPKIVVRFYSAASKKLTELKDPATLDFLKANHMWMHANRFDTLRESSIGFLLRVHPDATNRTDYASHLHDFLSTVVKSDPDLGIDNVFTPVPPKRSKHSSESSAVTPVATTQTCPPFSIVARSTGTMGPATQGKKAEYIPTRVLQIRCETVHAARLQNILAAICDKNQLHDPFIPHSLKVTDPSLYLTVIQAQNIFLSSASAIRVDGFTTGALDLPYDETATDTTLRSMIMKSGLFSRIDETVSSFRSDGRALFVTDFARQDAATEFIDNTLKAYFEDFLTWEQKELLLLPNRDYPTRVSNRRPQSDTIASYLQKLSTTIPPLATVEFDSSDKAPPSSKTNAWTQKRNPVFFHDKLKTKTRSIPRTAAYMSDTSSVAESTNTAPTLATQLSHTEALIDSKLAAFKTEIESSFKSHLDDTFERLVAPLITKMEELIAQRPPVSAAPPIQTPVPLNTTVPPPNYHHNAPYDQPYASREPDNVSVHTQSPGRPLPPQGYPSSYPGQPIIYHQQPPPPYYIDSNQGHAPPPNYDPSIYTESYPHPDFAAQQQSYYNQSQAHPGNYTQHQYPPASSVPHSTSFTTTNADLSMAELHHTMTDPNQSIINHTMTDPNTTVTIDQLPDNPRSPPAAPKGILKITSDRTPSGGASK